MLLFWFGVAAQLIIVFIAAVDHAVRGYSDIIPFTDLDDLDDVPSILYPGFAHFIHMVAAYWLSKGRKKGLALGLFISTYEIVSFLIPAVNLGTIHLLPGPYMEEFFMPSISPLLYAPQGFVIRVLFAVIIYLMISGRKELINLQTMNWRPWMFSKIVKGTF